MRFLGTGAADMIPSPFCECPVCRDARRGGHTRLRSHFLLDAENLIDFGPDLGASAMKYGLSLSSVQNVFITHTHEDHFALSNMDLLRMGGKTQLDMYMSEAALDALCYAQTHMGLLYRDAFKGIEDGRVRLHAVKAGEPFMAGGYEVTAVDTTHHASAKETAVNYRFVKEGLSLLYACDTGMYLPRSLEILQGSRLDVLIMEGTWGGRQDKPATSHLNAYAFLEQLETFKKYDIIKEDTDIYCSHINHRHDWSHEAYQKWFKEHTDFSVTVAEDGLIIYPKGSIKEEA